MSIHGHIKRASHLLGVNRWKWLQRAHDYVISFQIPFVVSIQGVKMSHPLLRMWLAGVHEPATTVLVKRVVKPGMVCVDLGAHFGYYTMLFAKLVGEKGKVYAFEPHPTNMGHLLQGKTANGFWWVTPWKFAISDKDGTADFSVSSKSTGRHALNEDIPHEYSIRVRTSSLDSVLGNQKVDFIKMDIEGAELKALEGMRGVIANNPQLMMTVELKGESGQEYLDALRGFGFTIAFINEDGTTDIELPDSYLLAYAKIRGHINLFLTRQADPHTL